MIEGANERPRTPLQVLAVMFAVGLLFSVAVLSKSVGEAIGTAAALVAIPWLLTRRISNERKTDIRAYSGALAAFLTVAVLMWVGSN